MKTSTFRALALAGAVALLAQPAAAQTVQTFEAFPSCDNSTLLGVYQGINFESQFICYSNVQAAFAAHSGIARLRWNLNAAEAPDATFTFLAPTVFQGAWFTGSASTSFSLFLGGNLVFTSATQANTAGVPIFQASGYAGNVDRVRITGDGNTVIVDDLTYGGISSVTPEPSSLALMFAGIGAVGLAFRRRRRSN